jgi:hypothetical protein
MAKKKPPLRCRWGFHWLWEQGCLRCGYRLHGNHAEPYRSWAADKGEDR